MKTRKGIIVRKKQSRIETPKENIWFYSESSQAPQPSFNAKNFGRNERLDFLQEGNKHRLDDEPQKLSTRKTTLFVVDWQMSDVL